MQLYNDFTPFVSIILPTFNRDALLGRAIDSVLEQTYRNWELIVVDDGSSDSTCELVKRYIKSSPNIRYMFHNNKKLPFSLNTGVLAASGEIITFLGSDDEYKPEHLQLRVDLFLKNKNIEFIHGGVKIIGDPFVKDKNDLSKLIHLNDCTIGGTFFIKKYVLTELNGFRNIAYSEDSDFFERAVQKYKIHKSDYPTYIYHRETSDSICNTI